MPASSALSVPVVRTGVANATAVELSVETAAVETAAVGTGEVSVVRCSQAGAAVQTEWVSVNCVLLPAVGKGIGV